MQEWCDPYPCPVIEYHDGVAVVRDDLLNVGSKVRFLDYLIGHDPDTSGIEEWVYGSSPATGYAQISLPIVCSKYGKKAVLFMAKRDESKLHEYQKRGIEAGAVYHWVNMGMLAVTEKRARDYVAEDPTRRRMLPIGLSHPTVEASIIRVARSLPLVPDVVWSVASSGTLSRGLQAAWPNAQVHAVSVGHKMAEWQIGRAIQHRSPYPFDKPVKKNELPPFPSAPTYDAKGWSIMQQWRQEHRPTGTILYWNVAV